MHRITAFSTGLLHRTNLPNEKPSIAVELRSTVPAAHADKLDMIPVWTRCQL